MALHRRLVPCRNLGIQLLEPLGVDLWHPKLIKPGINVGKLGGDDRVDAKGHHAADVFDRRLHAVELVEVLGLEDLAFFDLHSDQHSAGAAKGLHHEPLELRMGMVRREDVHILDGQVPLRI